MKKYKILAFFGKSGAGKDTAQKWVVSNVPCTKGIISCTTRPKRDNEKEGVDYHFLDEQTFLKNVSKGKMLESTKFNNWFYGTRIDELDINSINVGVFNIQGIKNLMEDPRLDVEAFYIDVSDKNRLLRALSREENPNCYEICRRFLTDEEDFKDIPFSYATLTNNDDFSYLTMQLSRFI